MEIEPAYQSTGQVSFLCDGVVSLGILCQFLQALEDDCRKSTRQQFLGRGGSCTWPKSVEDKALILVFVVVLTPSRCSACVRRHSTCYVWKCEGKKIVDFFGLGGSDRLIWLVFEIVIRKQKCLSCTSRFPRFNFTSLSCCCYSRLSFP